MAGNILKAVIDVSAPGAKAVFEEVASLSKAVDKELSALGKNGELNFKSINTALKTFKDLLSRATDPKDITKLNLGIAALQNKLKDLPPSAEKTHAAVEKVHGSMTRATSASLRLGHTFGLLPGHSSHVAHGLETIMHTFEQLKEQTGSSEKAFKGLFASIAGSVGIGLAIAAVTLLAKELFHSEDAAKASEKALAGYTDALDDAKKSVEGLTGALQFFNQLGSINTKIFELGDLSDLRQQSIAQSEFTQNLLKEKEKRKKIADDISNDTALNSKDRIEAERNAANSISEINKEITESEGKQRIIYRQIQLQKNTDQKELDKLSEEQRKKYLAQLKADLEFEEGLRQFLVDRLKAHFKEFQNLGNDLQKIRFNIQVDIGVGGGSAFDNFTKQIPKVSSDLQKELDRLNKTNPINILAEVGVKLRAATEAQMEKDLKSVNDLIKGALDGAFAGIGEGLGEALAGGDMKSIFGAFVNAIGQGVQAIGKQLITLGTVALAAKLALKSLFSNPALMVAAGIALVAVGSALNKVLGGGLKGFAQGGFTGAGGRNEPAGVVHRGEFVIPVPAVQKLGLGFLNQLAFGGNIRGFQNGGSVSGVVGGGAKVSGVVYVVQRGKDLIGTIDLAKLSQGRL